MTLLEPKTIEIGDGVLIDVNPSQDHVQLRWEGKSTKIKKTDLWAACFAIADEKTQSELMPVRQTQMMSFVRQHKVRLKKDMREGEILVYNSKVDVPVTIVEGLQGLVKKKGVLDIA